MTASSIELFAAEIYPMRDHIHPIDDHF